jgi:hypothetical protein
MIEEEQIPQGLPNVEVPYQKTQPIPWDPSLFKLHTLASYVGSRGKGKTNAATNLILRQVKDGYFTRVFIISPTYDSNEVLHEIPVRPSDIYRDYTNASGAINDITRKVIQDITLFKNRNVYSKLYNKFMEAKNKGELYDDMSQKDRAYMEEMQNKIAKVYMNLQFRMEYNPDKISPADSYMAEHAEFPPSDQTSNLEDDVQEWPHFIPPYSMKHPVPCLFIDDMSHSDIYGTGRSNPLVNLSLRHRHLGGPGFGITIYFAVQTFKTGVPKALRTNCQQFFIFQGSDVGVLESMYEEFAGLCSRETFFALYDKAVGEDPQSHDFLTVDKNAASVEVIFRKNYNIILHPPKEVRAWKKARKSSELSVSEGSEILK